MNKQQSFKSRLINFQKNCHLALVKELLIIFLSFVLVIILHSFSMHYPISSSRCYCPEIIKKLNSIFRELWYLLRLATVSCFSSNYKVHFQMRIKSFFRFYLYLLISSSRYFSCAHRSVISKIVKYFPLSWKQFIITFNIHI